MLAEWKFLWYVDSTLNGLETVAEYYFAFLDRFERISEQQNKLEKYSYIQITSLSVQNHM